MCGRNRLAYSAIGMMNRPGYNRTRYHINSLVSILLNAKTGLESGKFLFLKSVNAAILVWRRDAILILEKACREENEMHDTLFAHKFCLYHLL